jgi:hypothetical protein
MGLPAGVAPPALPQAAWAWVSADSAHLPHLTDAMSIAGLPDASGVPQPPAGLPQLPPQLPEAPQPPLQSLTYPASTARRQPPEVPQPLPQSLTYPATLARRPPVEVPQPPLQTLSYPALMRQPAAVSRPSSMGMQAPGRTLSGPSVPPPPSPPAASRSAVRELEPKVEEPGGENPADAAEALLAALAAAQPELMARLRAAAGIPQLVRCPAPLRCAMSLLLAPSCPCPAG